MSFYRHLSLYGHVYKLHIVGSTFKGINRRAENANGNSARIEIVDELE
jgi:hypothetical protein